jgi:diphosphomevalonate decarboxylase
MLKLHNEMQFHGKKIELRTGIRGEVAWESPSNIALVKYWGKRPHQIPQNPSLSFTLKNALARTKLTYAFDPGGMKVRFTFSGKENEAFGKRVEKYLTSLKETHPWLEYLNLEIDSENNFPHSAGIASSAAGLSSLALCLNSMNYNLAGLRPDRGEFLREASNLSRLASGSAARSVYGGYTTWGAIEGITGTSDNYSTPLPFTVHPEFMSIKDAILIIHSGEKTLSSSKGHDLLNEHPFAPARFKQAEVHTKLMMEALRKGDWNQFISITELEALTLHGLIMSSEKGHLLLKPGTLNVIEKIREFRQQEQLPLCFTIDAGPNVHLIYHEKIHETMHDFIESELKKYCQDGQWIDDGIGAGPELLQNTSK